VNKRILKQLVDGSYTKNDLDEGKVTQITKGMKRKDLKKYISLLKQKEKSRQVTISIPIASINPSVKKIFFDAFPGKSITIREDKLLLLGAKITADDLVYDFSLKRQLEDFLYDLEENYDEE